MACNIDHTLEDVQKKLQAQEKFLPDILFKQLQNILSESLNQDTLNEVFHLLKKYDLSDFAEQTRRNEALRTIITGH